MAMNTQEALSIMMITGAGEKFRRYINTGNLKQLRDSFWPPFNIHRQRKFIIGGKAGQC